MAQNPYYTGPKRQDKVSTMTQAQQGPDISLTLQQNERQTRDIIKGIDSLNQLASGAIDAFDKVVKYDAVKKGKEEADVGKESSASPYAWGGFEQQAAYNTIRSELAVRDMPAQVTELMKQDPENKKPLDEMTEAERTAAYTRARGVYFEQKGIKGSTYEGLANMAANEVQNKHMVVLNEQARALGHSKAVYNVQETIAADARAYGGDPAGLEANIEANFNKYAVALGSSQAAQEAIAKGLLGSVTSDNPSLEALTYLKSPEAAKRFSSFEGFDQVVKQADIFTTKAQEAFRDKRKKGQENGFYINLSSGGFQTPADVDEYLKESDMITPEEKFNLRNKAVKYIQDSDEATNLQGAVNNRQYNVVNAQKPEILEEMFKRNVGGPDELNLRNMSIDQENALVGWIQKGYNVPKWIGKFGDSPLNNGDQVALDSQLKLYSNLKARLGETGVGTVFSSSTQAKLEEYARLRADTTITPADRKKTLDNFDTSAREDANGISVNSTIRKELSEGIKDKIASFSSEGGSRVFGGPDDLQPAFTFSGMDRVESQPSFDYANQSITGNYAVYRRAGLSQDEAYARATDDFQKKNQWVEWTTGTNKNSYVPKEFGSDFANRAMKYMEHTRVLEAIAVDENLPVDEVRRRITVQPARDYNSTRKVSVYLDGVEKNVGFTSDQFFNNEQLMNQAQIDKTVLEYQKRINSPEYKKQIKEMSTVQRIMKDLGFVSRDKDVQELLR